MSAVIRMPDYCTFRAEDRRSRSAELGLTLVELSIVLLLLSVLSITMYSSINGILSSREMIRRKRETMTVAQSVFLRFSAEFDNAREEVLKGSKTSGSSHSAAPSSTDLDDSDDTETEGLVFVRSEDKRDGGRDTDSITFATLVSQAPALEASNFGAVEVRYHLERDSEADESGKGRKDTFVLIREEAPAGVEDERVLKVRSTSYQVARGIAGLNFRYYSGDGWLDSWEATDEVPDAIEVTLSLASGDGSVEVFRTAFAYAGGQIARQ